MGNSIIKVESVVLPVDFVFKEIKQLNSGASCKVMFNQSDNDTCRICCD